MSFVRSTLNDTETNRAANTARQAGNIQSRAGTRAIATHNLATSRNLKDIKSATERSREAFSPFLTAGQKTLPALQRGLEGAQTLTESPEAQLSFIQDNPFFDALAERSKNTLLNRTASAGKTFSGGTAEALQNSLLLLGSDLVNQNLNQRSNVNTQLQNLVSTGLGAASGISAAEQQFANIGTGIRQAGASNVADLTTQRGNVRAAGLVGSENARTRAQQDVLNREGVLSLSDIRTKENIQRVGYLDNGIPLYKFNYKGSSDIHINVIAQEAELINPSSVVEINGLKYVNMEQVCR